MEKNYVKRDNRTDYKEKFQFLLSVNGNIICQRYFKINGFDEDNIKSLDFTKTIDESVEMIQEDLAYKSRIYLWYNSTLPTKLTGFIDGVEEEYLENPKTDKTKEEEMTEPYSTTFKFSFLVNEIPVYERIWDGSQYPKYVRNSVDLTNSDYMYKDIDKNSLNLIQSMNKSMTLGRPNLMNAIIRSICETLSRPVNKKRPKECLVYKDTKTGKEVSYCLDLDSYNRNLYARSKKPLGV